MKVKQVKTRYLKSLNESESSLKLPPIIKQSTSHSFILGLNVFTCSFKEKKVESYIDVTQMSFIMFRL